MKPVRISLISYLNSRPFVYGLRHSPLWDPKNISFDIPAISAQKVIEQKADLGIIPVATLPLVPNGHIIGNYCISAENEVYTVALFANQPIEETCRVFLDRHSRTSVALTRVLASSIFRHTPVFIDGLPDFVAMNPQTHPSSGDCFLIIGDKVFEYEKYFTYKMDLGLKWKQETGLPFVFAAWISNRNFSEEWIGKFNAALSSGVNHIPLVSQSIQDEYPGIPVLEYLTRYIQFELTPQKRSSIEYFLKLVTSLS